MWRGRRPACVIAAIGGLGMLAFPAAAPAVKKPGKSIPKVKTRTSSSSAAGSGAIVSTTALCPPKHRAVGGGFEQTAPSLEAIGFVYESVKSGQAGWRVSSQILDETAPASSVTLTAYVRCRKIQSGKGTSAGGPPKTSVSSVTQATPAADQTGPTAQAICSAGRQAMAGGFATSPPVIGSAVRPIVLDSLRSGSSSWQTLVLSGQHAGSVTSHAYCARKVKAPGFDTVAGSPTAAGFGVSTATASCPPKKQAVHGGFRQTGATPTNLMVIFESRAVGNGWRVSGSHLGAAASTVESTSYCA